MTDKVLLILNPKAGTLNKREVPGLVASMLAASGTTLEMRETRAAGEARTLAAEAARQGYRMVVTAGGDGTVSEAASGLLGSETPLGIIPCGSGNGLARAAGIPQDFALAAKVLRDGKALLCDSGEAAGHPFFCTFGMGFDAEVSMKFAREKRRGRTTYIRNAIRDYLSYKPQAYSICIDGHVITERAFLIAVCNASQYGNNAYIAPKASLCDGLLDVTVVHTGSLIDTAMAGLSLFTGQIDKNTLIDTFRISHASILRLNEGPAHIDGEPVEMGRQIEIDCRPASLRIMVPRVQPEFKPIISPLRSMLRDMLADFRNTFGIYN